MTGRGALPDAHTHPALAHGDSRLHRVVHRVRHGELARLLCDVGPRSHDNRRGDSRRRRAARREQVHPPRTRVAVHRRLVRTQAGRGIRTHVVRADVGPASGRLGDGVGRGQAAVIFGSLRLPRIAPFDADLFFVLRQTHSVLAYTWWPSSPRTCSAVLLHTLTLRDGMLSRMAFALRRADPPGKRAPKQAGRASSLSTSRRAALRVRTRSPPPDMQAAICECTSAAPDTGRHRWTRRHG